jgi:hypothetical protein
MQWSAVLLALALLESVDAVAFDPSLALDAPTDARALLGASDHHGCGSAGRFALMPHHIDREYEAWAWAQVKAAGSQADGCNNCALEPVHARRNARSHDAHAPSLKGE